MEINVFRTKNLIQLNGFVHFLKFHRSFAVFGVVFVEVDLREFKDKRQLNLVRHCPSNYIATTTTTTPTSSTTESEHDRGARLLVPTFFLHERACRPTVSLF